MFRLFSVFVLLLTLVLPLQAQSGKKEKTKPIQSTAFNELVKKDRDFSALAQKKGVRAAFLETLADSGVIFRPKPINGIAWYEINEGIPGKLKWEPAMGELSSAGDLGFTTGPFRFDPDSSHGEKQKPTWGQYLTIWKKNSFGDWKVFLNYGSKVPEQPVKKTTVKRFDKTTRLVRPNPDESVVDSLLAIERSLSDTLTNSGYMTKLKASLHPEAQLYRDRFYPRTAKKPKDAITNFEGFMSVRPIAGLSSSSKDLAYVFGNMVLKEGRFAAIDHYQYVRVWKRDSKGNWKILVDLVNLR